MGRSLVNWQEAEKFLLTALIGLIWGAAYRRKGFLKATLMAGCEAVQARRFVSCRKGKTCIRKGGGIKHTC